MISSIGSVPEVLPGVAMKGEYYTFSDEDLPRYSGSDRVFGVGNVVTGQGNIRVSLVHSQKVTKQLVDDFMSGDSDGGDASADRLRPRRHARPDRRSAVEETLAIAPCSLAGTDRGDRAAHPRAAGAGGLHLGLRLVDRQGDPTRPRVASAARSPTVSAAVASSSED